MKQLALSCMKKLTTILGVVWSTSKDSLRHKKLSKRQNLDLISFQKSN